MDYEIKNGELALKGDWTPLTGQSIAKMTLLWAKAHHLTTDETLTQLLTTISPQLDGPNLSALERKIRTEITELLASGWTPNDNGTLD